MPYEVLDTGRPAVLGAGPWEKNVFPNFVEALEYAVGWLGEYAPSDLDLLAPGLCYHYFPECYVEIRRI